MEDLSPQTAGAAENRAAAAGRPAEPATGEDIDLFKLWDILWAGKLTVIIAGFICTACAAGYAVLATPVYEAELVMLPADEKGGARGMAALAGQLGGLASIAGLDFGRGSGRTTTSLRILESYPFLWSFIERHGLLQELFADRWDEKSKSWLEGSSPPSQQIAANKLKKAIHVEAETDGAYSLIVEWTKPDLAAAWANELIADLNRSLSDQDVHEAKAATVYLTDRISETSNVEMQRALYRLVEAQAKTIMLANVRSDYIFRVVDPALPPLNPSHPRKVLIVLLGGFLGGVLGVCLVLARLVVGRYRGWAAR